MPKAPPARSASDLEEKRKAVVLLAITRWIVDQAIGQVRPGERLADQILADLHEHECWGNFDGSGDQFINRLQSGEPVPYSHEDYVRQVAAARWAWNMEAQGHGTYGELLMRSHTLSDLELGL